MIEPETKDWTWVLTRRCDECGTDSSTFTPADVPAELAAAADGWDRVLHRPRVDLRPDDSTWSPLEYGAHSSDVLTVMRERLGLMLRRDEPTFPDWDQDQAAVDGDYRSRESGEVAESFRAGAAATSAAFAAAPESSWGRRGLRGDGAAFTVTTLAQYLLHDIRHHLHDVGA